VVLSWVIVRHLGYTRVHLGTEKLTAPRCVSRWQAVWLCLVKTHGWEASGHLLSSKVWWLVG